MLGLLWCKGFFSRSSWLTMYGIGLCVYPLSMYAYKEFYLLLLGISSALWVISSLFVWVFRVPSSVCLFWLLSLVFSSECCFLGVELGILLLVLLFWVWYSSCILYSEFLFCLLVCVFWVLSSLFWVWYSSSEFCILFWVTLFSSVFSLLGSGMWYSEFWVWG